MRTALVVDKTVRLDINGSSQRIRMCGERPGLPPLLVVQAGPGLPLLHEVAKFQQRLHLENHFLVGYWEQRGCGVAPQQDARSVSLQQQIDDLRTVLQWLHKETKAPVIILAISLGATVALRGLDHESDRAKSIIAVSPDAQTADSDASVYAFLQEQSLRAGSRRLSRRVMKAGKPPYVTPSALQRRARLLADLGTIERGKSFSALFRETLFSMIGTYGVTCAVKAFRNMNLVQGMLLPELVSLDLLANPPRLAIPAHYIFGERDALIPVSVVKGLSAAIAAPTSTVALVPNSGHMVHFDSPEIVRSIVVNA